MLDPKPIRCLSVSASFHVSPHWLTRCQHRILLSPRKLQATLAPMALRRRMLWYLKGFVCLCCRCQSEAALADPARVLSCGSCGEKMGWQYLPGLGCHGFACLRCGAHATDEETKNEKTWHGVHYFKSQIKIQPVFFHPSKMQPFHSSKMYFSVTLYQSESADRNQNLKLLPSNTKNQNLKRTTTTLSSKRGLFRGQVTQQTSNQTLLVKLVGKHPWMSCLTWKFKFDLPYLRKESADFSVSLWIHIVFHSLVRLSFAVLGALCARWTGLIQAQNALDDLRTQAVADRNHWDDGRCGNNSPHSMARVTSTTDYIRWAVTWKKAESMVSEFGVVR